MFRAILCEFLVVLLFTSLASADPPRKEYTLKGTVSSVDPDRKTFVLKTTDTRSLSFAGTSETVFVVGGQGSTTMPSPENWRNQNVEVVLLKDDKQIKVLKVVLTPR